MAINGFGFTLTNGREIAYADAEFKEKLPITSQMIDAIERDDDLATCISAMATAILRLEARGVEFDE